jgi:hypothetical protein
VDEANGRGQERQTEWDLGCVGGELRVLGRASGGVGGPERSGVPGLIEVVGEGFLGGLSSFTTCESHVKFSLGWPPGGMDERGQ